MILRNNRTIGLTITRVLISLILIKDFLLYLIYAPELLGKNGIVPILTYAQILDGLGLEYLFVNFNNPTAMYLFLIIGLLASCFFLVGYKVKLSGLVIFFCLITVKLRAIFIQDGADNIVGTMLPFLLLAATYNLWNGKLNNNFKSRSLQIIPVLAALGILIEFCLVYFVAGLSKIVQPIWQNGEAMYYVLRIEDFRASDLNIWLTQSAFFVKFSTWFTLFWELTFPFVIWFKKLRNVYLLGGLALHFGIWMLMRIDNFSFVMLSIYPVFFYDHEYRWLYRKYLKKWIIFPKKPAFYKL
ncbi:HTTM domain-containing protein [Flavobacteriaceae bacterium M23B6Z8]